MALASPKTSLLDNSMASNAGASMAGVSPNATPRSSYSSLPLRGDTLEEHNRNTPPIRRIPENKPLDLRSIELENHGDEAITLIQGDSTIGAVLDIARLIFSSLLLLFSAFSVIYAIVEDHTLMPEEFEPYMIFIILTVALFCLGVLEGLQIAVVELAHQDPVQYQIHYRRASQLLTWENTGRNVERFLIGRQVLVVLLVFVCARITTFDAFITELPQVVINSLMFSGFLGVILVVIVAQLTPQVLAAAYPVEFLNLPLMSFAFGVCLFVETTGLAHAVWLLCYFIKSTFYSCLCKYHHLHGRKKKPKNNQMLDGTALANMSNIAKNIEIDCDDKPNANAKLNKVSKVNKGNNQSKIGTEIESLMQQINDRPDLFYLFGDNKYPGAAYYYTKFKEAGLNPPCFLLSPNHLDHIPPHIVAMALLKQAASSKK